MELKIFVVETKLQHKPQIRKGKSRTQTARTHPILCSIESCNNLFDEKLGEKDEIWLNNGKPICYKCAKRINTIVKDDYSKLNLFKTELIRLFGGLTEINNTEGYWVNNNQRIEEDKGRIWIIYPEYGYHKNRFDELRRILNNLKHFTGQKVQFYTIDNEPHYI